MGEQAIRAEDFTWLCGMLREETAIVLNASKTYLVEARLRALARSEGIEIDELLRRARSDVRAQADRQKVIEAMTTNETSFFRDTRIFRSLVDRVLPQLFEERAAGEIRIWCAATSTGQEPYSVAMAIREGFPAHAAQVRIIGTDLDTQALARAEAGVYSGVEVQRGLPPDMLQRFFERDGSRYRLSGTVRSMVEFRQLNLVKPWPRLPSLDLVLIRNVLIYFDRSTKGDILTRAAQLLTPKGMLVLGGTESAIGCEVPLVSDKLGHCTVYRRKAGGSRGM